MALPFNYPSSYDASWPIQPSLAHYESPYSWPSHYESPYPMAAQFPSFNQDTTQVTQFLPQPISQTSHLGWDNHSDFPWNRQSTSILTYDPQSQNFQGHPSQSHFCNDAYQEGHMMQPHSTYPQTCSIDDKFMQLQQIIMSNQQTLSRLESRTRQLLEETLKEEVESQHYFDGLTYQPIPPCINDPIPVDDLYEAHDHQSPNVVKTNEEKEPKLEEKEKGEDSTLNYQPTLFLPHAFDVELFQVEDEEISNEKTELSALPWASWEMEEPVISLEICIDRAPSDFGASVDSLPTPNFGEPIVTAEILQLADWSTPPEPAEHLCVQDDVYLDDSFTLDTSKIVESQQSSITQSDINIANSQVEVMDECCGSNKVQIDVLNTYKDLNYEEEYYVMHDMIINILIPLLQLVGLLGLLDPLWFMTPIKARLWRQLIGGVT